MILTSGGEELIRAGRYYGPGYTNNEAEATAMVDSLECLQCLRDKNPALRLPVRLWGDSQLVVKHLLGIFKKPGKVRVYDAIVRAKELKREWRKLAVRHTLRDLNQVPDDMARRALEAKEDVVCWDGAVLEDAPANQMKELYEQPDSLDQGYLVEAPTSYPTFWKRVIDLLPHTARCIGGQGEPQGGIM